MCYIEKHSKYRASIEADALNTKGIIFIVVIIVPGRTHTNTRTHTVIHESVTFSYLY